jgi:fructokinase
MRNPARAGFALNGLVSCAKAAQNVAPHAAILANVRVPRSRMPKHLEFIGLGEALIDLFEDGDFSLGGAPLNVAVHAHHLLEPLNLGRGIAVSAVGPDKWGAHARAVLAENSITADYLATNEHPTGTASVFMRNGEPGFEIALNVAWDYLRCDAATDALADRCDAVCFGSLAQRSESSKEMIRAFLARARRAWRLYDVNFRRGSLSGIRGYSREIVESSCRLGSAMKANEQEMLELGEMFEIAPATTRGEDGMWARMEFLRKEFALEAIIVTRAARGAMASTSDGQFAMPPAEPTRGEIHPVGAGDAFSAGVLFGRSQNWPWRATLELAAKMGSWVTRHVSAIPRLSPSILDFARDQMKSHQLGGQE